MHQNMIPNHSNHSQHVRNIYPDETPLSERTQLTRYKVHRGLDKLLTSKGKELKSAEGRRQHSSREDE